MEQIIKRLRTFYYLLSMPAPVVFALSYFTAEAPLVSERMRYILIVALYLLALVVVPVTYHVRRKAANKSNATDDAQQTQKFVRAFKIHTIILNVISYLCSVWYVITVEKGCCYMFAIVTVILLLSYPTAQFVFHKTDANA